MNMIRAAELLIEKIKTDYKDDIALVVIMGSYIYGETHSRSDLDMFFVPNTERGYNLGFTFVLDGVGFDYWPISWERLEHIANFNEKTTSIITEGKVLYYSSEADIERFNQIKQKALDTRDRRKFIHKASDKLNEVYKDYWGLLNAHTISDGRIYAIGIIYTVTYALALLNRITVKRGRGKLKQEILNMPLVPEGFSELYDTVFTDSDIDIFKKAYGQLIQNTETLILREKEKICEAVSFTDALSGFYEEMINFYNKIYHACETHDAVTALFASAELTNEIEQALKDTGVSSTQLPDLVGAFDPNNLEPLVSAAQNHQVKFVELLTTNGVKIRQFISFDELKNYLITL
ncbi:MAG: hypothetical protein HPY74_06540 [Firmicutes bacterium]|nr:hypothetical protein [Bacillota bacterium]